MSTDPAPYFDAHAHIAPAGAPSATGGAALGRMLCAAAEEDWPALAAACAAWPGSRCAYGIHPWYAHAAADGWADRLHALLAAQPLAWVGECGLDGLRASAPPLDVQQRVCAQQLRIARALGRPVNLHCVKAWPELVALLDQWYVSDGPMPFVVHAFAGPHQYIRALADRGACFTFGPLAARPGARRARARAAAIPPDRLLLETDCFLVPPADRADELCRTAAWLADARQTQLHDLTALLCANAQRMFHQ